MAALSFADARSAVIQQVRAARSLPPVETVNLNSASGRILAVHVSADRDYPALPRSMRDGFALRAADLPAALTIIGEVRAGDIFSGSVAPGQAVEIMTGAPMPHGTDTVVMIEHVQIDGGRVAVDTPLDMGANVNPRGCEAREGEILLTAGRRIEYPEIALLASLGVTEIDVYRRPRVAILATGDELVDVNCTPAPHQIRNSNSYSLARQVARAGGDPVILPVAPDNLQATQNLIGENLHSDLLLLTGGVSAGKYDVVENALHQFHAEFFFDRVLIQPGQPCVFGKAGGTFFFGLPGNPASTMVCFEVLARAALELIAGAEDTQLPICSAPLLEDFHHKPGLTRFLPARLNHDGTVSRIPWSGSADIAALTRANCYLIAAPDQPHYQSGEQIQILLR